MHLFFYRAKPGSAAQLLWNNQCSYISTLSVITLSHVLPVSLLSHPDFGRYPETLQVTLWGVASETKADAVQWCWICCHHFHSRNDKKKNRPPMWHVVFLCLCSNVQGDSQTSICITIEPGLLLKGDILVRTAHTLPRICCHTIKTGLKKSSVVFQLFVK